MLEDGLTRAFLAAAGLALLAGPVGCAAAWRRQAGRAAALAPAGLAGLALGAWLELPNGGLFAGAVLAALALHAAAGRAAAPQMTLLAAPVALAAAILLAALLPLAGFDLAPLLLGGGADVSRADLALTWSVAALSLAVLALIWRPLVAGAADPLLAAAEGLLAGRAGWVLAVLEAVAVALAVKLCGILFAAAFLALPAAAARRFAATPERMAVMAAATALAAAMIGLDAARRLGVPSGPTVILAAAVLAGLAWLPRRRPA